MLKELSEDLNSMKKIQSEAKDTLIKIKNNLQGNNSRMEQAKNQINDLEYKNKATNQSNNKKKESEKKKKKDSVSSLWDNFKHSNIHIIGVPEEEREQDIGNYLRK